MPDTDSVQYWIDAMKQNCRWNPLTEMEIYPERLEHELVDAYLRRLEAYHRKAVDDLAVLWMAKKFPEPVNKNHLALLKERFRFAVPLLKVREAFPARLQKGADIARWALIDAWAAAGAEAFVEQVSSYIQDYEFGQENDSLISEWLRSAAGR